MSDDCAIFRMRRLRLDIVLKRRIAFSDLIRTGRRIPGRIATDRSPPISAMTMRTPIMNPRHGHSQLVARSLVAACLLLTGCSGFTTTGLDIPLLSRTGLREEQNKVVSGEPPSVAAPSNTTTPLPPKSIAEFDLGPAVSPGEQRFQTGDGIKVAVWGYPELDHTATVQPNGHITLPLVGEVNAAGLSVSELRARITDALKPYTSVSTPLLRPGDQLAMDVWQRTELSKTAVIAPDGSVTLPLVGRVIAAGRPVEDIRNEVQERMLVFLRDARVTLLPTLMNRRVLYDYQVSVLATHLEPRRAAIIGEVGLQGLYEIKGSLRLLQALAQAQVVEKSAAMNSVIVIRNRDSAAPLYRKIRLTDFIEGNAPDQNIYLQHEDIVIVPKTAIAKAGDFVEQFFARTAPMFSWWSAAWQASVAPQTADTTKLINESLKRNLLAITPN